MREVAPGDDKAGQVHYKCSVSQRVVGIAASVATMQLFLHCSIYVLSHSEFSTRSSSLRFTSSSFHMAVYVTPILFRGATDRQDQMSMSLSLMQENIPVMSVANGWRMKKVEHQEFLQTRSVMTLTYIMVQTAVSSWLCTVSLAHQILSQQWHHESIVVPYPQFVPLRCLNCRTLNRP